MKRNRQEHVVSVEHAEGIMSYTVRGMSKSQALQYAVLKYPNAKYIHVLGGDS